MQYKQEHSGPVGKTVISILLIVFVLLLNAMAAPAVHELIHKDADRADHQCAATLFAHGQVAAADCDVPLVRPVVSVETIAHLGFPLLSTTIENLPPGRAPPTVASPQV